MLRVTQQEQENTGESDDDGQQKAPPEPLLTQDEDFEANGDQRDGRFEHGGKSRGYVLFSPEDRAIGDHKHQGADRQQASPLFGGGTGTPTKAHDCVKQPAGQEEAGAGGEQRGHQLHGDTNGQVG